MNSPIFSLKDTSLHCTRHEKGGDSRLSVNFILDGNWVEQPVQPFMSILRDVLQSSDLKTVYFNAGPDFFWDSGTMAFVLKCHRECKNQSVVLNVQRLPEEVQTLFKLAISVPENPRESEGKKDYLKALKTVLGGARDGLHFLGEVSLGFQRLVRGRSDARWSDGMNFLHQSGPAAIPIVTLLSFLVGMILAYLGTVQLRQFGVEVYVANLVGLGMVREMGALMTAIIMAGRTGASYAAQLGTMQVNEEVDALTTLGVQPVDYLVIPRMLALIVATPLLTIYSNILGMMGGAAVATSMDITPRMYFYQLSQSFTMHDVMTGVMKSLVFGALIAFAGCHAGMRCGRSSAAVGQATTTAVVTAIMYLVIADAGLNILFFHLGI